MSFFYFIGVGKSATIRAISTQAENILRNAGDDPNCPRVLLCAFTGKAANLIGKCFGQSLFFLNISFDYLYKLLLHYFLLGGVTYHSAFSLKLGNSQCIMSDKTKAELRHTLAGLKLLVIDEISLVGAGMLYRIHHRLCDILQVQSDDKTLNPFANINVLFVGDLMQLPPVMANEVFREPRDFKLRQFHESLGDKPLWKQFQPMILKENHRQGKSKEWADTLNRIRVGNVTPTDEALLRTRLTDEPFLDDNALHLFRFNKDVTEHNEKMLKKLLTDLISVKASISLPKGRKIKIDKGKKTIEKSEFMETFEFKIGARVTMIKNIDLMDDLYNGAGGTVVGVEYKNNQVHCIIVQFDIETCGKNQRAKYPGYAEKWKKYNGTPIFRDDHEFKLKTYRGGFSTSTKGKLSQFPLRLYYASTAHKIQVKN